MSELTIRLAELDDAQTLSSLHCAVAEEVTSRLGEGYWSKQPTVHRMREKIKKWSESPAGKIFVAESDRAIVATTLLSRKQFHYWRKRMWECPNAEALCVYDFAVHPSAQGRGLGKTMMLFAETMARESGLDWIRLDAFALNPISNKFYQSLGYAYRGDISVGGVLLSLYEKEIC